MSEDQKRMQKQRVLVIDDEQMVRDVLVQTIQVLGYESLGVAESRSALTAVESFRPNAILLDLVMPDRDGFEVLGELRLAHPDIPVIAMSGGGRMAASQLLRLAEKLGASQVLPKPFSLDQVDVTLQSALAVGS